MKIAAVVILYNPSNQFTSNILSYLPFIDRLYIADNSAIATKLDNGLLSSQKVVYLNNGSNLGIAARLNFVCEKAIKEGYEWLLTMDQDSSFSVDTFETYLNKLNLLPLQQEVALVGCNFYPEKRNQHHQPPQEAQTLITSGTFINLNLFSTIGLFDENLFIDEVDTDYCIRANISGYKNLLFPDIDLRHSMGSLTNRASIKTLYLIKKRKVTHSPIRCYYMYRNLLYIEKKFKSKNLSLIKQRRKDIMLHLKTCFYYGGESLQLIRFLIKAYFDANNNRMGKIK